MECTNRSCQFYHGCDLIMRPNCGSGDPGPKKYSLADIEEAFELLLTEHVDEDFEHRNVIEWAKEMILTQFEA